MENRSARKDLYDNSVGTNTTTLTLNLNKMNYDVGSKLVVADIEIKANPQMSASCLRIAFRPLSFLERMPPAVGTHVPRALKRALAEMV